MTGGELLVIVVLLAALAVNERCGVSPRVAFKIIHWAARLRYNDPTRAEIRVEEYGRLIDERPLNLLKVATALGFLTSALFGRVPYRVTRSLRKKRESRYSASKRPARQQGTSVEVRFTDGAVHVTEAADSPVLVFSRGEWEAFLRGVSHGEFDLPT